MNGSVNIEVKANVQNAVDGLRQVEQGTKRLSETSKQGAYALNSLSQVARDLPFGFVAIQNNLPIVVDQFGALARQSGGLGGALKAVGGALIGPAGISFAFGAVIAGITALTTKYGSLGNALNSILGSSKQLSDFQKELVKGIADEASKVETLVQIYPLLEGQRDKQNKILKQLNEAAPTYFKSLDAEKTSIEELTTANEKYIKSLLGKIFYESQQERIKTIIQEEAANLVKLTDVQVKATQQRERDKNALKSQIEQQERLAKIQSGTARGDLGSQIAKPIIKQTFDDAVDELVKRVQSKVGDVFKGLGTLTSKLDFGDLFKDDKLKPDGTKTKLGQAAEEAKELVRQLQVIDGFDFDKVFLRNFGPDKGNLNPEKGSGNFNDTSIKAPKVAKVFKSAEIEEQTKQLTKMKEVAGSLAITFSDDLGAAVGTFVDDLISGKDAGADLFKGLVNAIKAVVVQFVALLATALALYALVQVFPELKPILEAMGAIGKGANSFGDFISGRKHASGGVATEATFGMIGEAGPEAIIPLSQLAYFTRQMSPQVGGSWQSGGVQVSGVLVGRGNDLLAVVNSAGRTANRSF